MQYYYPKKKSPILSNKTYGFTHIYFGQGAGKTSRCIGLAIRAAGAGLDVTWIQFMKSGSSSETKILRKISSIFYYCPGNHPFILSGSSPKNIHYEHAEKALEMAKKSAKRGVTLLICDEILNTVIFKILNKDQLIDLINICKGNTELIMSGVNAIPEIIQLADYITEFIQHKHPYYNSQSARLGIEC